MEHVRAELAVAVHATHEALDALLHRGVALQNLSESSEQLRSESSRLNLRASHTFPRVSPYLRCRYAALAGFVVLGALTILLFRRLRVQ